MKNFDDPMDWIDVKEHQMLGEIFLQSGKITLKDLGLALDIQEFEKIHLGEILISMKIISKKELELALELQRKIDFQIEK